MEIRTEVEILAPAAAVWKVLLDFERYPEWNPFIVKLEGEPNPGARLSASISLPETAKEHHFRPHVLVCEPERELRLRAHFGMKGLLDGEHFFRLIEQDGRTRFAQGQDLTGILLRFALASVTLLTRGCVYMNQALKQRVEGGVSAARSREARGALSRP